MKKLNYPNNLTKKFQIAQSWLGFQRFEFWDEKIIIWAEKSLSSRFDAK